MVLETRENGGDDQEKDKNPSCSHAPDLKPEYCHYKDEGCEYARSCLECPFPHCLYDRPHGKKQWLKELRNEEIRKLSSAGWSVKDLALLFGVCRRTVHRALGKK